MNDSIERIPQPSYPAVACCGLTKAYPGTFALNGIDLELPRGQIIGLLGPNGSGKTTLIKILAGLLTPTSGTVLLDGLAPGTDTRSFVSYLPDRSYLTRPCGSATAWKCSASFTPILTPRVRSI